jgi:transcriptional regulator with XRE-family HTH domain
MPTVAKFMCQRGATMAELADAFNVSSSTLYNWLNRYPEFHEAVHVNADVFNVRVERALAERAIGFFVTLREEERDAETGRLITPAQRQYYPPDPTSMIFFLKNRMRERYRDEHKLDTNVRLLKTSEELRIEIHKDILELQAQGYDPRIIDDVEPELQRRSGSSARRTATSLRPSSRSKL